jgi:hypothetical protein
MVTLGILQTPFHELNSQKFILPALSPYQSKEQRTKEQRKKKQLRCFSAGTAF